MRTVLFILAFIFSLTAQGTNYYVSTSGSNSNDGLTTLTPWQTMAKITTEGNAGTFGPGDQILFKRADEFIPPAQFGGFRWWAWAGNTCPSGVAGNPIVFSNYGTGVLPNFVFQHPTAVDSTSTIVMSFDAVDYITIDGLSFYDTRFDASDKVRAAWTAEAILLGESGEESNNCIVQNCYFRNIGFGVNINGNYNTVQDCIFLDMKNVFNAPDGSDVGANPLTLGGTRNYILRNYISGGWAYSESFGLNGGAIEFFNNCDSNVIAWNTIVDCAGVAEFGALGGSRHCYDNIVAFNKIINCGGVSYVNVGGTFAIQPRNNQFYNNVIIENDSSRFSGANFGEGFQDFPAPWPSLPVPEELVFNNNGSPVETVVWNLQNNIIVNYNNMDVMVSGSVSKTIHLGNLYKLSGGSAPNYTLSAGEVSSSAANWTDTTSPYPYLWNFNLLSTSPARGIGEDLSSVFAAYGLDYDDFAGTPVATPFDAGILQYVVPPVYRNTYSKRNKRYQNAP